MEAWRQGFFFFPLHSYINTYIYIAIYINANFPLFPLNLLLLVVYRFGKAAHTIIQPGRTILQLENQWDLSSGSSFLSNLNGAA